MASLIGSIGGIGGATSGLSGLVGSGAIDGITSAAAGGAGASQGGGLLNSMGQGGSMGQGMDMLGEYMNTPGYQQAHSRNEQAVDQAAQIQPIMGYQDMSMPGNNTGGLTGLKGLLALMQQARR